MDMSVTINPNSGDHQRATTQATTATRSANSSDLDAWLEKVEALGELKRITAEVDPDLEAATMRPSADASPPEAASSPRVRRP